MPLCLIIGSTRMREQALFAVPFSVSVIALHLAVIIRELAHASVLPGPIMV